jgi:hypothetical protein
MPQPTTLPHAPEPVVGVEKNYVIMYDFLYQLPRAMIKNREEGECKISLVAEVPKDTFREVG